MQNYPKLCYYPKFISPFSNRPLDRQPHLCRTHYSGLRQGAKKIGCCRILEISYVGDFYLYSTPVLVQN